MAEQWLSIVEYSRTYNVSDMTIRRRIKTGKLHAVLRDGKYFIPIKAGAPSAPVANQPAPRSVGPQAPVRSHSFAERAFSHNQNHMATAVDYSRPHEREESEFAAQVFQKVPQVHQRKLPNTAAQHAPNSSQFRHLPVGVIDTLSHSPALQVQTQALLEFCENALSRTARIEAQLQEQLVSQGDAFEAKLRAKDLEIQQLTQQNEDLQVLVKLLERKSAS